MRDREILDKESRTVEDWGEKKEQQSVPRAKSAQPVCVISIIRGGYG